MSDCNHTNAFGKSAIVEMTLSDGRIQEWCPRCQFMAVKEQAKLTHKRFQSYELWFWLSIKLKRISEYCWAQGLKQGKIPLFWEGTNVIRRYVDRQSVK